MTEQKLFEETLAKLNSEIQKKLGRNADAEENELLNQLTAESCVILSISYFREKHYVNGVNLYPIIHDNKVIAIHYDDMEGNHYQIQRYLFHKKYQSEIFEFLKRKYQYLNEGNFVKIFPAKFNLTKLKTKTQSCDYNWYSFDFVYNDAEFLSEDMHEICHLESFPNTLDLFLQNRQKKGLSDVSELIANKILFRCD